MKLLCAICIIIFAVILEIIAVKIICFFENLDKKMDMKKIGFETEDYDNGKQRLIAKATIMIIVIAGGFLYMLFVEQ